MKLKDMCAKQLNKKLFISDLDGTLLKIGDEYSKGVSDENRKAILEYVARGNVFAIASARDNYLDEISPILGFRPSYIGGNGSVIIIDNEIDRLYLNKGVYNKTLEYIRKNNMDASVLYGTTDGEYINDYDHYPNNCETTKRPKGIFDRLPLLDTEDDGKCYSLAILIRDDQLQSCKEGLKQYLNDMAEVVSSDTDLININPKNCTKGKGVLRLAMKLGIDIKNVGVVGDSENDISMFDVVENSYVMDHASDDVKSHARYTVKNVKEALKIFDK